MSKLTSEERQLERAVIRAEMELRVDALKAVAAKYRRLARVRLKALKSAEHAAEETEAVLRARIRQAEKERDQAVNNWHHAEDRRLDGHLVCGEMKDINSPGCTLEPGHEGKHEWELREEVTHNVANR